MNKTLITLVLAVSSTFAALPAAQADDLIIVPAIIGLDFSRGGSSGGSDPVELGTDAAFKTACLDRGGQLISEFKSNGRRGFRCFVPSSN